MPRDEGWPTDTEFYEKVISDVTQHGGGLALSFSDSTGIGVEKCETPPKVGQTARLYGRGLGYPVRGIVVEGNVLYYRTPEQETQHRQSLSAKHVADKRAKFEERRAQLDAAYRDLHPAFKARLDKFRSSNPNFRWEFEAYEMSCCTDAQNISSKLRTVEAIDEWLKLPFERQKEQVSIFDGHSGNSFGCAVHLAKLFLDDPKNVILAHGALTPLVGCKDYGCPHPYELPEEFL